MNEQLSGTPRSDIGPILDYLVDVTKLPPEVVRPEQYNFRLRVLNGVVNFQSPADRVDPEYVFALRRIKAAVSNPDVNSDLIHLVEFNPFDQGRGRAGIFRNPINMSILACPAGPAHDMVWDGFYAFVPGSDMELLFIPNLPLFPLPSDVTFFVSLTGDLVRVRRLPNGTLTIPGMEPEEEEEG